MRRDWPEECVVHCVCVCVADTRSGVKEREQNVQLLIPSMHVCMYDASVAASVHSRCGLSERRV